MTAPASGTSTATVLPDYALVPWSSLGPTLRELRYDVGCVERNPDRLTDVNYHSAFLTTPDGLVLFDAPPSIDHKPRQAADEVAAAEGVTNTLTQLVYSDHHADHEETRQKILQSIRFEPGLGSPVHPRA